MALTTYLASSRKSCRIELCQKFVRVSSDSVPACLLCYSTKRASDQSAAGWVLHWIHNGGRFFRLKIDVQVNLIRTAAEIVTSVITTGSVKRMNLKEATRFCGNQGHRSVPQKGTVLRLGA